MNDLYTKDIKLYIDDDFTFTRYLYIKDEVIYSLILNLLEKKTDQALFWAYELYYSGFKYELLTLIVKIYYLFYASLNASFEKYLLKKVNEELCPKLIATLINNLSIRPFNLDVFLSIYIEELFDMEIDIINNYNLNNRQDLENQIEYWIKEKDYQSISHFVINDYKKYNTDLKLLGTIIVNVFNKIYPKLNINTFTTQKIYMFEEKYVLLSKIYNCFHIHNNSYIGKNLYVKINEEDLKKYETIIPPELNSWKIMSEVCIYNINENKLILNIFNLKRPKYSDLLNLFREDWLYNASLSPLWMKRIMNSNGNINTDKKIVTFNNEDDEEKFHNMYNLEPDEQSSATINKCIPELNFDKTYNYWKEFYDKYNKNGFIKLYEDDFQALLASRVNFI